MIRNARTVLIFSLLFLLVSCGTEDDLSELLDTDDNTPSTDPGDPVAQEPDNLAPSVVFSSPDADASFEQGSFTRIEVTSTDEDGEVVRVDLVVDGVLLRSETQPPFVWGESAQDTAALGGLAVGEHELMAVAVDDDDASATTTIAINIIAAATSDDPDDQQDPRDPGDTDTPEQPDDPDAIVPPVPVDPADPPEPQEPEVPQDEQPADEPPVDDQPADEPPADDQPADERPADDQLADEEPADEQPVDDEPADEEPADPEDPVNFVPSVSFATPAENALIDFGAAFTVEVLSQDIDGDVSWVDLSVDGVFLRRENVAPYQWGSNAGDVAVLSNLSSGQHTLTAVSSDDEGSTSTRSITINVAEEVQSTVSGDCEVMGELEQWNRVAVVCEGPQGSEDDEATFTDNRFNVTFTQGISSITVPGHFAADNDAAETGATSGNLWRAYFSPNDTGTWNYTVSFREGQDIAVSLDATEGTPVDGINGASGSFSVASSDATAPDMRSRGLLRQVDGERYLRFAGDNSVFIQGGVDSPENIFGYFEFDNTEKFDNVSSCKGILHEFLPHGMDWNNGDPSWDGGRGTHLIGLINYFGSRGVNSVYIMMNTVSGDGCDAHPWVNYNSSGDERAFDVSKLDQWEIALDHMQANGIMIHAMTQETENDQLLNNGNLGLERQLYYRELISRFAHHPALQWNLGEENSNTDAQRRAYSDYIKALDPYDHPIQMHTFPSQHDEYEGLLGHETFDGPSIQVSGISEDADADGNGVYGIAMEWLERSADAGDQWVVTFTEASGNQAPSPGQAITDRQRVFWMWASVMSGGGGFEWYLRNNGQGHALDLAVEDLRDFDVYWEQSGYLVSYFRDIVQGEHGIDMLDLEPDNSVTSTNSDWVLSDDGSTYLIFLREGGSTDIDLTESMNYAVQWFNPRTGETVEGDSIAGPGSPSIGNPPSETGSDWALLLTAESEVVPPAPNLGDEFHPDIVRIADIPESDILQSPRNNWVDSYSVGDQCYCYTTFDHDVGDIIVDTSIGTITVRDACEAIGPGPGIDGRPRYNDVQCGNGPANDAGDEDYCPGRVDLGKTGCVQIGPTWKF